MVGMCREVWKFGENIFVETRLVHSPTHWHLNAVLFCIIVLVLGTHCLNRRMDRRPHCACSQAVTITSTFCVQRGHWQPDKKNLSNSNNTFFSLTSRLNLAISKHWHTNESKIHCQPQLCTPLITVSLKQC